MTHGVLTSLNRLLAKDGTTTPSEYVPDLGQPFEAVFNPKMDLSHRGDISKRSASTVIDCQSDHERLIIIIFLFQIPAAARTLLILGGKLDNMNYRL